MLGQMPFDSHRTPARQTVLYLSLGANWPQILQHAVMQEMKPRQHAATPATPPTRCRAALCKLLMCYLLVLLSPSNAWAAMLSVSPNDSAQIDETTQQRTALCAALPDELPVPTAPDVVAEQLRQTIQRTQDTALQAKLRNAYLHYLGCRADIRPEN